LIEATLIDTPEFESAVIQMVTTAKEMGAPPSQIRNFAIGGYTPTRQQWKFHSAAREADNDTGPIHIGMGGARGGAKSHAIMSQVALDDCQRYPGLDVLYLRLVQKAGRKALDQLRAKTIMNLKHIYNRNEGLIKFPNGSTIVVGHFKNEGDIDKYIGIEYDIIVKEEATQLTQVKIDQLHGSLRTGKPGWRPRTYNAANPGGIGHNDFRSTFVLPYREGPAAQQEALTKFIPMDWRHNPFLNPEYKTYLMNLTGMLALLWRDGDWDVGAGTFFIHWEPEIHVVDIMDRVPLEWPIWVSMDWGWAHPCDVQWHTMRPDGAIITIAEYNEQRRLVSEVYETIVEMTDKWDRKISDISTFVAGHDIFSNRGGHPDGLTIADQFRELGIQWTSADVDRISGAAQMATRLGNPRANKPATWFVTANCVELTATLPNMLVDEKRPEDVLKFNADEFGVGGDDAYDAARYGLMEKPMIVGSETFQWRY
jgi:hypothetical protein